MHGKTQKTQCLCGIVREASFIYASVSSQSRYDHFDTSPYSCSLFASSPILSKPPGFVNSRAAILRFPPISPLIVEKPAYFMKIDQ